MAHNRLHDDTLEYRQSLLESTGPIRYVLDQPKQGITGFTADPRITTQGFPVNTCNGVPLVDADSELMGITRKYGKCDQAKYNPHRDAIKCTTERQGTFIPDMDTEDCRLSNPPCTLRCTGWNRFEWLCKDPQDTALEPFASAVDYRRVAKDNHRPLIDKPMIDSVLPNPVGSSDKLSQVDVGLDIQQALASFPELPVMQHWRDAGEIRRIYGCQSR